MTNKSIKTIATQGILWSAIDRFVTQGFQFIIGIMLARLLMPEDFGLIGMLSIFIAISQSFINSGMGSGLIQKKNRTEIDFSTVFVFNFLVSASFYVVLFISAPLIADFYNIPQLVLLTRVLTLNIIINSISIVPRTRLTINIDFKTIASVNVVSVVFGGLIAVYYARVGLGVWALVIQSLSTSFISVIMFLFMGKWTPSFLFSKHSFNNLFGFGSKLLIAGLYAQIFNNIYNIAIGKVYSAYQLGFYTRAKGFADVSAGTVTSILQQVTYPILTSMQDDKKRMVSVYGRLLRMTSFIIFPAMTMLALLADPLIRILLGEKWTPVIVLLQWMSFARIITPISSINMNILNAVGRSDLFLKVDLSKLPLIIIALLITIPLGVKAIVIGHVVTSLIAFFFNAYMPGKLFGYGALEQIKGMFPVFISTTLMATGVLVSTYFVDILLIKLIIGSITGLIIYIGVSYLLKSKELNELKSLLLKTAGYY